VPPTGPKNERFVPAIPISNPAIKPAVPVAVVQPAASAASQNSAQAAITEATRAATAAVAAAMAKLPQPNAQKKGPHNDVGVDAVTKNFNDMKPYDGTRGPRGNHQGPRGGRGGHRGGHAVPSKKIEVPDTDFDFELANAKFNKQDLVKEAIATGSPIIEPEEKDFNGTAVEEASVSSTTPSAYNKASSFFDNISSETRDREEGASRPRERRGEAEKKNIETFGQGSVDGYRGGYRGRGRGRGYGGPRGRGGYNRGYGSNRGRGGFRGGRGASQSTGVPTST
jgi:protein LSM14